MACCVGRRRSALRGTREGADICRLDEQQPPRGATSVVEGVGSVSRVQQNDSERREWQPIWRLATPHLPRRSEQSGVGNDHLLAMPTLGRRRIPRKG